MVITMAFLAMTFVTMRVLFGAMIVMLAIVLVRASVVGAIMGMGVCRMVIVFVTAVSLLSMIVMTMGVVVVATMIVLASFLGGIIRP